MTLFRLAREGGVDDGLRSKALLLMASTTLNGLATGLERRVAARRIEATPFGAPIFILGHYRSGTSLLHKLLMADSRFGSADTFDVLLPGCPTVLKPGVRWLLQHVVDALRMRNPYFHDWPVRLDDPNEVEPVMMAAGSQWSGYWGYVFLHDAPRLLPRYIAFDDDRLHRQWMREYDAWLRWIAWRNGGSRLVVKDPLNTGRVGSLAALYPNAGFVSITRDPRAVFVSMVRLWRDTVEPLFGLQRVDAERRYRTVYDHYETLMTGWDAQRGHLPQHRLLELRYEQLMADPMATVTSIYEHLGLDRLENALPAIRRRIARERPYREHPPEALEGVPEGIRGGLDEWSRRLGYGEG